LPEKQQTEIKSAVNEVLGAKTQFKFNTAPELISGIELTSNGYKLAWSISEYLNSLQKNILETLNNKTMKDETKKVAETPNVDPKAKSNHKA
jgi:F-type H+-transporting ATPase subunit b